jgi:hypothetical protein
MLFSIDAKKKKSPGAPTVTKSSRQAGLAFFFFKIIFYLYLG